MIYDQKLLTGLLIVFCTIVSLHALRLRNPNADPSSKIVMSQELLAAAQNAQTTIQKPLSPRERRIIQENLDQVQTILAALNETLTLDESI